MPAGEIIHKVVTEDLRPGEGRLLHCELGLQAHIFCSMTWVVGVPLPETLPACVPVWLTLCNPIAAVTPAAGPQLCMLSQVCPWSCPILLPVSALAAGPWPEAARQFLSPDYIQLAEACWARQAMARPSAPQVLQRLLDMLAVVEGRPTSQDQP